MQNSEDNLTKQEIFTLVEVMTKNASNLENISNSLEKVTIGLDKIIIRLYNGLTKEIITEVGYKCKECKEQTEKNCLLNRSIIDSIKIDTYWLKIILGGATLIALAAELLLKYIKS